MRRRPRARLRAGIATPIATRAIDGQVLITTPGSYPIVAANEDSPESSSTGPPARLVGLLLARVPTLRNNQGALTTLLASGLGVFFALSIVDHLRRSAIASASQEVGHRPPPPDPPPALPARPVVAPFRGDRPGDEPVHPRGQRRPRGARRRARPSVPGPRAGRRADPPGAARSPGRRRSSWRRSAA